MKKVVVLGGTKGIGKAISNSFRNEYEVLNYGSKLMDTSNLDHVKKFIDEVKSIDVLILNTGGPPPMEFFDIDRDTWNKYHNQLFLSFIMLLQNANINTNGYIFAITSIGLVEPNPMLTISQAYRQAFSIVFKTYSKLVAEKGISAINILPGSILTERLKGLVPDVDEYSSSLIQGHAGDPNEIGSFIRSIVDNEITYLNGSSITFDGGNHASFR